MKFDTGDETEIYGHILLVVEIADNIEHFAWRFAILCALKFIWHITHWMFVEQEMYGTDV